MELLWRKMLSIVTHVEKLFKLKSKKANIEKKLLLGKLKIVKIEELL